MGINLSRNCTINWRATTSPLHTTLFHYFLYPLKKAENCTMGKIFHTHRFTMGWKKEEKVFLLSAFSLLLFCSKIFTERLKTLLKTEHLKYLRLKTNVTNNFLQNLAALSASFQWEKFGEIFFSVLLSIFLIHCLRAMKLVLVDSNVPVQLNENMKNFRLTHLAERSHLLIVSLFLLFVSNILLHNIASLHFGVFSLL